MHNAQCTIIIQIMQILTDKFSEILKFCEILCNLWLKSLPLQMRWKKAL